MSYETKCMLITHKANTSIYDDFYYFYILHNDTPDVSVDLP